MGAVPEDHVLEVGMGEDGELGLELPVEAEADRPLVRV
jgi:hypothetical protein